MRTILLITGAFLLGAAATWLFRDYREVGHADHQQSLAPAAAEREILYYRHPHSPRITSNTPMKDEMGMDYIPIYADEGDSGGGSGVRISPEVIQNLGVRTALVRRGTVTAVVEAFARADYDEEGLAHVHVRAEGWVERLTVRSLGERVNRGDLLFEWYSPALVNAQEEFLRTLRSGQSGIRQAARDRLLALDIPAEIISHLESRGEALQLLPVYAPAAGVVTELGIRDGMYITPSVDLLTLADLSSVWVYVDLFEHQAPLVTIGQPATLQLAGLPETELLGEVTYLAPQLDPRTRTVQARLRFANPTEQIKPNMYGRAFLHQPAEENLLLIPREALIQTGDSERVILADDAGRFTVAAVQSGGEFGEEVAIITGLAEGDRVVVSGQFLLDSESSLRAAVTRMTPIEETGEVEASAEPLAVWTEGIYHGPGRKEQTISLSHQPIPEFGWPAMKMDLPLAPGVALPELTGEAPIRFELERLDEITYQILTVEALPGDGKQ
ncbi:MAG: efflux RND transporter periplasmic adaptor subunit [Desulforhopalus sp.]|jgi:Cu(I)/Ag(I) efflux system membrane fusion protein|nr:efflux RND transporter periplasmic adaptor subunit [Desulforhopalus sp.]